MAKPSLQSLTITESNAGQRVDRLLKNKFPTTPYIAVQKLLRQGRIRLNGVKCKPDTRVAAGDELTFPADIAHTTAPTGKGAFQASENDARMIETNTVYEDNWLLVINKPAGLPAQAGGGQTRSLDRILVALYGEDKAPRLVHRLDRETTGLIVCAKNRTTAAALSEQFSGRTMQKEYLALVHGPVPGNAGRIEKAIKKIGPIAKIATDGDHALTTWKLVEKFPNTTCLISCTPHTGRMNQLRIHFADAGFPIVGDDKYGPRPAHSKTLHLHAWHLTLTHPQTQKSLTLEAPLPPHFAALTHP